MIKKNILYILYILMDTFTKNPGIKYLVKINVLTNLFNNSLANNNINDAFNALYKMRIVHGHILYKYNKIIKKEKICINHLFKLSCISSVISVINDKITNSEIAFNKHATDNKIDPSTLKIELPNNTTDSETSTNAPNEQVLPLFEGEKSKETLTKENIDSEINGMKLSEFDKNIPSLILFFNPGCPACMATKPNWDDLVRQIKKIFEKNEKLFNIIELDLSDESNSKLATLFQIEYIPTIIMMESSNKPAAKIEKITGISDKSRIQDFIKQSFSKFSS